MKIFPDLRCLDRLAMRLLQESGLFANQVSKVLTILEILELDLSKDDKFIVLASDGVWEFL